MDEIKWAPISSVNANSPCEFMLRVPNTVVNPTNTGNIYCQPRLEEGEGWFDRIAILSLSAGGSPISIAAGLVGPVPNIRFSWGAVPKASWVPYGNPHLFPGTVAYYRVLHTKRFPADAFKGITIRLSVSGR